MRFFQLAMPMWKECPPQRYATLKRDLSYTPLIGGSGPVAEHLVNGLGPLRVAGGGELVDASCGGGTTSPHGGLGG